MVLQILTSVVYEIVQQSWTVISITAKYYLIGVLIYLYADDRFGIENFQERIILDSRFVVGLVILAGTGLYFSDVSLSPVFPLFSELVALGYLGYLFWVY